MDTSSASALNPVQLADKRFAELWHEVDQWIPHWKEITDYQLPRAGRYFVDDTNKGQKRHSSIHDNTVIFAGRTLGSGLMSGMTSPARPWFRCTLRNKRLAEMADVKVWLHEVAELLRAIFAASNTYRALHSMYEELGPFGTAATIMLPDFENVVHHYPLTIGSYALGTNFKGQVDTLVRRLKLPVHQMVDEFGLDNCSDQVKTLYRSRSLEQKVEVRHIIQPRRHRNMRLKDSKNMAWASCYYEPGQVGDGKWLRESGFKRFPVLAPRWHVTGEDTYGQSPGMECLGDVKQLQHQQLRKAQAIDYQTNPPLQVPAQYAGSPSARLPGGLFHVDQTSAGGGVRSAFEVQLNLQHLAADMVEVRERIRSAYYADLFMMLANDTRSGITATEVAERHEEKMLMLGPVLERLHNELLSPMIELAFGYASDAGILPPVPEALRDQDIEVEFISTLAQAQRMVGAAGLDRLLTTAANLVNVWPEVRHKINPMQAIDDYSEMFGTNPAVVVDDESAGEAAAAEAQARQAQMAAAQAPEMAKTAKLASEVDTENLREVIGQFTGYSSPTPSEVV